MLAAKSKKQRIAVLASALWTIVVLLLALQSATTNEEFRPSTLVFGVLGFAALPLMFLWGIAWVKSGSKAAPAPAVEDFLVGVPLAPEVSCPRCGASMKLKTTKSGPHAGKVFWGCSRFPTCIQIAPLAAGSPSGGA